MSEFRDLPAPLRALFLAAVVQLVADFRSGEQPRHSLRVKRVQSVPGVWELSWAADGRATFQYGRERIPGEPHIIWRRISSHDIFRNP